MKFVFGRTRFPDKKLKVNKDFSFNFDPMKDENDTYPIINQESIQIRLPSYKSVDTMRIYFLATIYKVTVEEKDLLPPSEESEDIGIAGMFGEDPPAVKVEEPKPLSDSEDLGFSFFD